MAVRATKIGEDAKAQEQELLDVDKEKQAPETANEIVAKARVDTKNTLRGQKAEGEMDEDEVTTGVFEKIPKAEKGLPRQEYVPESEIEQVVDVVGEDIPVTIETIRDARTMLDRINERLTGHIIRLDEIKDLKDLLGDVKKRYGSDAGIKREVTDLVKYLGAARLSYEANRERPKYYSEDEQERIRAAGEQQKIDEEEALFKRKMEEREAEDAAEAKYISDSLARSAEMAEEMVKSENKRPIVIHKNIPQPGTVSTPETTKKTPSPLLLSIQGKIFELPQKNTSAAKSTLKEIETFVRANDVSNEEEKRLLAFTQGVEKAYSGRAVFEKEIGRIMNTLETKQLNKQYTAVQNVPEIPVKIRKTAKEEVSEPYMSAEEIAKVPVEYQNKIKTPDEAPKNKPRAKEVIKAPEQVLREAVGRNLFLSNLFLETDRKKKLSHLNTELDSHFSMNELIKAVQEYLAKVGTDPQKKYDKKKVLENVNSLFLFGIKPEKLDEFAKDLKHFLMAKMASAKPSAESKKTPLPVTNPEPRAVAPTLVDTVIDTVIDDGEGSLPEPLKTPTEDLGKIVGKLDKTLRNDPEFSRMMESLRKIQRMSGETDQTTLDGLQKKISEEDNESFKTFMEWILQEKTKPGRKKIIRKLMEELDDKSPAMVQGVIADTLLRLDRVMKVEPKTDLLKESMEALKGYAQLNQLPGLIKNFRQFTKDNPDLVAGIEAGAKREYIRIPENVLKWILESNEEPNTQAVLGKIIENLKGEKTAGRVQTGVVDILSDLQVLWGEAINARNAKATEKDRSEPAESTTDTSEENVEAADVKAVLQAKLEDYITLIESHPTSEEMNQALDEIGKLVNQAEDFTEKELEQIYEALTKTYGPSQEKEAREIWRIAVNKVVPTPEPAEGTENLPERTPMPDALSQAIDRATAGDEKIKERLLNIWEIYNDVIILEDAALTEAIKDWTHMLLNGMKHGLSPEQEVNILNRILKIASGALIAMEFPERKAAREGYEKVEALFENLIQADKYKELRERLGTIFRILKDNPDKYDEDDAFSLREIQEDFDKLMWGKLAETMGIDHCGGADGFIERFKALDVRQKKAAMLKLSKLDILMTNEVTAELIEDYERILNKGVKPKKPAPSVPPSSPPGTPPSGESGSAGPSSAPPPSPGSGYRTPPPSPDEPDDKEPDAATVGAEAKDEENETRNAFSSEKKKLSEIDSLLSKYGFGGKSKRPALIALRNVLIQQINSPDQLAELAAFLKAGQVDDEVDKLARETKEALRDMLIDTRSELKRINTSIRSKENVLNRLTGYRAPANPSEEDKKQIKELPGIISELEKEKYTIEEKMENIRKAIEKKGKKKGRSSIKYGNPEQLLGMVNMHFAKKKLTENGADEDEEPDYKTILELTHEQISQARKESYSNLHRWVSEATFGIFKPRLTTTLVMLAKKERKLAKLTPENMTELADCWDDQKALNNWIDGLTEISEADRMQVIVPTIIGYLENMVNVGGMAKLNTVSLNRAKWLLEKLHQSVLDDAIKHGKNSKSDTETGKLTDALVRKNDLEERSQKVTSDLVRDHMLKVVGTKSGLALGAGAGLLAMSSLSGLALAVAGGTVAVTGAAGAMGAGSFKVKDPETKAMLRRNAARGLAVGGIGALALGLTPWLAAPVIAGAITPDVWKNRAKIGAATKRLGPPVAIGTARVGWGATGVVLAGLGGGLPLLSKTYRRIFGLPFSK